MHLKHSFLPVLLLMLTCLPPARLHAQKPTTFVLVRHAETADDGTRDPGLSEAGRRRADRLASHLAPAGITAIYATPFRRTQQTVAPLAKQQGVPIRAYDPFDSNALKTILLTNREGTVVVAGHSNTTPALVNALIGEERFRQLPETDYATLFIVTAAEIGKGTVIRLSY